jgi:hypothetical protein
MYTYYSVCLSARILCVLHFDFLKMRLVNDLCMHTLYAYTRSQQNFSRPWFVRIILLYYYNST